MTRREVVRVRDVAEVIGGATPRTTEPAFWGGAIAWLTPKDLSDRPTRYTSRGTRSITEAGLENSGARLLPAGSVLLSSRAPIGLVTIASGPIATNQGFKSLLLNETQCSEYWYYLLGSSRGYLLSVANGSTFLEVSGRVVGDLKFEVPALEEQRRIAEVLGTLDDLIDTSERLKTEIDEVARASFIRAWDGETWGEIGELGNVTMGQSPPGDTYSENPVGLPFHQGIRDFGPRFPRTRIHCVAPTRVAEAGDILIAVRAPVGEVNVAPSRLAIGRGLAALRAVRPSSALQAIRAFESTWSAHQGTGTVFSSINSKDLRAAKVPRVEDDRLEAVLSELDSAYAELDNEVAELRRSRDELLPLLMSGKVRVRPEGAAA